MIYRHMDSHIQEYSQHIGVNQSALKVILRDGIQVFAQDKENIIKQPDDLYYEEKAHFVIGSAVDTYLTQGKDAFEEKYHFSKMPAKPSTIEMSIVKRVFDMVHEVNYSGGESPDGFHKLESYPEQIYEALNEHEYYMNRKKPSYLDDKRTANMLKSGLCQRYWEELIEAGDKQILSDEQYILIQDIFMSILTHKHTGRLFQDNGVVDIIFQMPLYFNVNDVDCKALVDHIIVNHAVKRIMPIDEKTTARPVLQFNRDVEKRRYDIQGAFYMTGIEKNISNIEHLLGRDLRGYSLANFAFVVQSTTLINAPMIYVLDDEVLQIGRVGDEENDRRGWQQALEIYKEWEEVEFNIEKKFEKTNGVAMIGKDYKYKEPFKSIS